MKKERVTEAHDEIDLYDYLRVLWRWRWMIAIGVIALTLLAIPAAYMMRTYESEGIVRLSEPIIGWTSDELPEKFLAKTFWGSHL